MDEPSEITPAEEVGRAPGNEIPLPPPLPVERKPAWWAWPLIAFALLPFPWVLDLTGGGGEISASTEAAAVDTGSADLALLKVQAQVVIASAKVDPKATEKSLEELTLTISGDRAVAALALLECFVQPDSPRVGALLDRFSESTSRDLAETTDEAVRNGVGEEGRERLRRHLGWFADLARGPGLSPPPLDGPIRARSFVVLAVMGLAVTGVGLGLVCGAVLLVVHLRRVQGGGEVNAFVTSTRHRGVLLECFALYLGIMTFGALGGEWLNPWVGLIGYGAAVVLPLFWPRFRGMNWSEFRSAVGLHRGQGWIKEVGAGCVGYLGVLAIASIGVAITLGLTLIAGAIENGSFSGSLAGGASETGISEGPPAGPEVHPVVGWIYEGGLGVRLACFVLAAGFAPLFEELFFRGALQRYFRGRWRFLSSALFTALIFAALHPQGVFAIPALAGIGVGFSVLREWRDSLIAPMTAHAINNGCLVGMLWWIL